MVSRDQIIEIIKEILAEQVKEPISIGQAKYQVVIDEKNGIFELKIIGWNGSSRMYGTILDFEIIANKVCIHYDGTEEGIALELERRGIPKNQIILGWVAPSQRKYTDYAIESEI